MMTPEFKKRLSKCIKLLIREMRDGCVACQDIPYGGLCYEHHLEATDMVLRPNKCEKLQDLLRGKPL